MKTTRRTSKPTTTLDALTLTSLKAERAKLASAALGAKHPDQEARADAALARFDERHPSVRNAR